MPFKVVNKTVEDREKSKEGKKKTLPTHTHKILVLVQLQKTI